jgi:hypothetical protein
MNYKAMTFATALLGAGFATGYLLSSGPPAQPPTPIAATAQPSLAPPASNTPFETWRFALILLAVLGGAGWYVRKRITSASADLPEDIDTSKRLERNLAAFSTTPTADVPRELLTNPWTYPDASLSFDERVQLAVEGSLRASRVLGLIWFDAYAGADAVRVADRLRSELQGKLRGTDYVRIKAEKGGTIEIAVFVPLLRNRTDLAKIAGRLMTVANILVIDNKTLRVSEPGLAVYPIDGYSTDDLIASAKANAHGQTFCITRTGIVQLSRPTQDSNEGNALPASLYRK